MKTSPSPYGNRTWASRELALDRAQPFSVKLVLPIFLSILKANTSKAKANYDAEADEFDWVVQTFNFDLSESDVFFVWLTRPGVIGITSHYFNITKEATSSSSSSTAASSTASTASSGAASTSVSRTSAAAQATNSGPAAPENNGVSSGTKIGIGVGVGFGVVILVLLSAVVALMLRKRKKRRQPISSSSHMVDEVNRSFPGPRPPPVYSQEMEDNQMSFSAGHPKSSGGRRVELE
jgi:hypothetical protein